MMVVDATSGSAVFTRFLRVVGGRDLQASVFETCYLEHPEGNTTVILECISDSFENDSWMSDDLKHFLLVVAGSMIFLYVI
jgi:hypothetical protein